MIRDDFTTGNVPDQSTWVLLGSPRVVGGYLNLLTSGDGVRGRNKFTFDDAARITVIVSNGSGSVFITPYEIDTRPDAAGVPYLAISYKQSQNRFDITVSDQEKAIAYAYVFNACKLIVKGHGENVSFTAVGKTTEGVEQPIDVATLKNPFYNQDVALYLFGGATNIDYVEAGSGRELMSTFMMENIMPAMTTVLALVMFIMVLRTLIRGFKHAV